MNILAVKSVAETILGVLLSYIVIKGENSKKHIDFLRIINTDYSHNTLV